MKKIIACLIIAALLPLTGCSSTQPDSDQINIVATLFPQYDFVRQIGGDKVNAILLLPPGQESHHYDPSPSDMAAISKSDLFIYTGNEMEPWAADIISSVGTYVTVTNASEDIDIHLLHEEGDNHTHSADPHIWLNLQNAITMCENICRALCSVSPENTEFFQSNLKEYTQSLASLDEEYARAFLKSDSTLVFGGKFALSHLVSHYNICYRSAYDSCSANSEPSIEDIALLSAYVKENDIRVVFCEEYSEPRVAREIASANNCEVLAIHSCHNLNRQDFKDGVTFLSLMRQNLENLQKGL